MDRRRRLEGAEEAVAAIAEAGEDIAAFVEAFVEHGDDDFDVGVGRRKGLDAFGGGEDGDDGEVADALALEEIDGVGEGAAGGEHGVEEERAHGFGAWGEAEIVFNGLEGFFVAVDADVADLGGGDEVEDAFDHAEAGAEDGDEEDLLAELLGVAWGEGGVDADGAEGEVAGDFVDEEVGEFVEGFAEEFVVGVAVAEDGELVLDEGVAQDGGGTVHREKTSRKGVPAEG